MDAHSGCLVDGFGRQAKDLRISVTDRCNLRCSYCLPEDQQTWIKRDDLLAPHEFGRLTTIGLKLGIEQVRITGGEPLLRPDLEQIISQVAQAFDHAKRPRQIALTTNGIQLEQRLERLVEAGLGRINVSLDTLNAERFSKLTKRPHFPKVLAGLQRAKQIDLHPIKINSVILDNQSLNELPQLVKWSLRQGFQWRAIEFMRIGPLGDSIGQRPTAVEIKQCLAENFSLRPAPTPAGAPAKLFKITGGEDYPAGLVGVIASTSEPFCPSCERTRISAHGKIYPCLFSPLNFDLLALLRNGASDAQIAERWQQATQAKPAGHRTLSPLPINYTMSQIGG